MKIDLPIPVIGNMLSTEFDSTVYYANENVMIHMDYMTSSESKSDFDYMGGFKITPIHDPESLPWLKAFNHHPEGQPKEYSFFNFDPDDIDSYSYAVAVLEEVYKFIYDNPETVDRDIPIAFSVTDRDIPDIDTDGQVMSDV